MVGVGEGVLVGGEGVSVGGRGVFVGKGRLAGERTGLAVARGEGPASAVGRIRTRGVGKVSATGRAGVNGLGEGSTALWGNGVDKLGKVGDLPMAILLKVTDKVTERQNIMVRLTSFLVISKASGQRPYEEDPCDRCGYPQ